jgi:glucose-1-phosphate thymidylyltransferase
MAGGKGSRLWPITASTNKHLLPVYDKPMIYYSLTTLLLAGVDNLLLVTNSSDIPKFRNLIGNGDRFGINIVYAKQDSPKGIPEGLLLLERSFSNINRICLALGDNLFYGAGLGISLAKMSKSESSTIFAYKVVNPKDYGVVELDSENKPLSIEEKPIVPKSNFAIPGLYFYDSTAPERARILNPSKRGELEITDVNKSYLVDKKLKVEILERGTAWLDTGTHESLIEASEFVKLIEKRQGLKIGSPEEAAWRMGNISSAVLHNYTLVMPDCDYKNYLQELLYSGLNFS